MKRFFFSLFFCTSICNSSFAQADPPENIRELMMYEDSLNQLGQIIMNSQMIQQRAEANYKYIPMLVKALKVSGSFDYPFSNVKTMLTIYPKDRSFRMMTWQLSFETDSTWMMEDYRYFGVIQMNSKELKIYPLFDHSDSLAHPVDSVFTDKNWFGMLYYNVIEQKVKKNKARGINVKKCYTLFGYDGNDVTSNKKVIDILWFDNDTPKFGLPVFRYYDDSAKTESFDNRVVIEYRNNADATLNYSSIHKKIVYDHLVPPDKLSEGIYFLYVPDGSYEGFSWRKKKYWDYVDTVFTFSINEYDKPPVPEPIKGMKGANDH